MKIKNYPFYKPNFNRASNYAHDYPLAAHIFDFPTTFWLTGGKKSQRNVDRSLQRLFARAYPTLPVVAVYAIPNRDVGQHSRGGLNAVEYIRYIDKIATGIGSNSPILVFEPDALAHAATVLDESELHDRLSLMKEAIQILTTKSNAIIYIDIGHSDWLIPDTAAAMLSNFNDQKIRGFSVNVSNFRTTRESLDWSNDVCELVNKDLYYVVDTSRNGLGPLNYEWCNPPGRALGYPPTVDTGSRKCDAYLWVKIPGESDGTDNGGPKAGRFWPEYAESLVKRSGGSV